MKTIQHSFPWTDKTDWAWTSDDVKLLQVIDDVNDVFDIIRNHVDTRTYPHHGGKYLTRNVAIQAGAACGIWPRALAGAFETVYTFEPLRDNFECAAFNLQDLENVWLHNACLGDGTVKRVGMKQHPNEKNNAGSQQVEYIAPGTDTRGVDFYDVLTIDEVVGDEANVDFIALDLEGYELYALMGAAATLDRCSPIVMVEDKGLSSKFGVKKGGVINWLNCRGYEVAETIKRDVILVKT